MRAALLFSLLALSACAASNPAPTLEQLDEQAAAATDECLATPALARQWGECNVKSTIFQGAEGIAACQANYKGSPGETLMLKIRLKPNGRVQNVKAEQPKPRNKPLERCLSKVISKLQFAAPPKGASPVIFFPFQQ